MRSPSALGEQDFWAWCFDDLARWAYRSIRCGPTTLENAIGAIKAEPDQYAVGDAGRDGSPEKAGPPTKHVILRRTAGRGAAT
jgi:hypothetical protein